ncbi:glycoside hydrolase family protein [Robertkochia solimangrovi]|uniref:glycoside hydrolase family protein n=1 Tax=Robertkochia solimangrovi TaxID=2213046 RepID=UPI00117E9DCA|nr:glycoside hydrolase family protein [Robertkochia solimangrovi]TRZ43522.1 hypothetical protein DMZ48_08845 [Robertkochia solimangrovi]
MKKFNTYILVLIVCLLSFQSLIAQAEDRSRPEEWKNLVPGARLMDLFLPMEGYVYSSETWGANNVLPRYIDNGIEDFIWSYWGGNIKQDENGKYHLFVAGWLENSDKGHMTWPDSYVFNTVSDSIQGPYKPINIIGSGHNPEIFQIDDGRYVLYVIDGRYVSNNLNGKWEYGKFDFNNRDRKIIEGLSNISFAKREDGSFIAVDRGGGIWVSKDGLSQYNLITDSRVYPNVEGRFEDPVIWKDHIQYHLIVNDWLGRIAWYLRSKDGINWVTDPGEAYAPGIAVHKDGTEEDWFKYERLKFYQDKFGRPIQANFAVIDTIKWEDKPYDNHSSKNISIPFNPGLLLEIENDKRITSKTSSIRLRIKAEEHFNPSEDIDIESLKFGAPSEVNFGRGVKAIDSHRDGDDLIVIFDGKGNGITEENFTAKLIGKSIKGELLYGYSRLPGVAYLVPILSARAPKFSLGSATVEIQNFGQVASEKTSIKIEKIDGENRKIVATGRVQVLQPFEKTEVKLSVKGNGINISETDHFLVTIYTGNKILSKFNTNQ